MEIYFQDHGNILWYTWKSVWWGLAGGCTTYWIRKVGIDSWLIPGVPIHTNLKVSQRVLDTGQTVIRWCSAGFVSWYYAGALEPSYSFSTALLCDSCQGPFGHTSYQYFSALVQKGNVEAWTKRVGEKQYVLALLLPLDPLWVAIGLETSETPSAAFPWLWVTKTTVKSYPKTSRACRSL